MTMGAFAVVQLVGSKTRDVSGRFELSNFNGLGQRNPLLAAAMSVFLLGLAGLPPGMAGLLGKFYVFSAAVKAGYIGLAVVGGLCSAVSCFYYLRVIVAMYFGKDEEVGTSSISVPLPAAFAMAFCVLAVVFIGIFPSPVYDQASIIINSVLPAALLYIER